MDTLSLHYQRLVGLNRDCVIASVDVDMKNRTLTLALEFSGTRVANAESEGFVPILLAGNRCGGSSRNLDWCFTLGYTADLI